MFRKVFRWNSLQKRYLSLQQINVGILGVPCEKGQKKIGVSLGPKTLRDGGLIQELISIHENINVKDYGDVSYNLPEEACFHDVPNMVNYPHIPICNYELSKKVEQIINDRRICLTLGGDHSIALGSVHGHMSAKEDICILWIDAHADLNTNFTSSSGNVHGMSMALLASELSDYWPYLPGMDWQKRKISLKNLAYIGLRSVDSYEKLFIDKFGIAAYGMAEIDRLGIGNVMSLALNRIDPDRNKSIHVSFDIDALDPLEAPSTGTAVRGGLTLREAIQIMEIVHDTGRLNAMDLVEVNPAIGNEKEMKSTVDAALQIILTAFGNRRGGLIPKELPLYKCVDEKVNSNKT